MRRRSLLGALGGLAVCPLCSAPAGAAAAWSWSGEKGPEHWGALPGFGVCGTGAQQSPIDMAGALRADLPPLRLGWRSAKATIGNPGYTIRVDMPAGSLLHVGRAAYQMLEFHFHAPSEHAVDGKRAAMEVHFVHRRGVDGAFGVDEVTGTNDWEAEPDTSAARFGVLGVLIAPGGANAAFADIMRTLPATAGAAAPLAVDPARLLPHSRAYWTYEGSLTTPGCAEVVTWMLLHEPMRVAQADIDRFTALYPQSARPLQPRNRRFLLTSG